MNSASPCKSGLPKDGKHEKHVLDITQLLVTPVSFLLITSEKTMGNID